VNESRYVIAGAARPRSPWFGDVAQWANAGAIPAEFVKCLGIEELRGHLASGRMLSSVLIDGGLPGLDRDLFALAREHNVAIIIAKDARINTNWVALGADAVLEPNFDRAALLSALASTASLVNRVDPIVTDSEVGSVGSPLRGHLFAVIGTGGAGTSTVSMAMAQGLGRIGDYAGSIALADLCLRADQAMLHDTQSVTPGIQELVEGFRTRSLDHDDIRRLCFAIDGRGYDLLIGLRRRRFWTTLRPVACVAALNAFISSYSAVICDTDSDLEGESESGSIDLEERNVLSRTAVSTADSIVVVGQASLKGLHSLTRVLHDIDEFGIESRKVQPVLNYAPQNPKARAAYASALMDLVGRPDLDQSERIAPPIFLPTRNVDECIRAIAPLPNGIVDPLASYALHRVQGSRRERTGSAWKRLSPGFLNRAKTEAVES
jgi:hypothetical protein